MCGGNLLGYINNKRRSVEKDRMKVGGGEEKERWGRLGGGKVQTKESLRLKRQGWALRRKILG